MRARRAAFAVVSAALMLVSGCSSAGGNPASAAPRGVRLYGVDGNMSNSMSAAFKTPGALSGMMGTAPLTPLSDDFKARLRSVDSSIGGRSLTYAAESYDAVVIAGLAVQLARTTDPLTVAKYINGVTALEPGGIECGTIRACLNAIAAGKDIAYRGVAVHGPFTDAGEPSVTSYGTLHFGTNNKIDEDKTEFVAAGDDSTATKQPSPSPAPTTTRPSGGALRLGILIGKTGSLGEYNVPLFAAARLAIRELNEAGGVLGRSVVGEEADDGTDPAKASAELDRLIQMGIGIIIGPSTSGQSKVLIPKIVASGRILISPSATNAALSTADDHGLFFRTCPSDAFQSEALADVVMRGGARRVYVLAHNDAYGTGLRDGLTEALVKSGIKKVDIGSMTWRDGQKDFTEIVQGVKTFSPDSVVIIGYEDSADVIKALTSAGVTLAH
jgi:ABC-type branched-subunit amino acid transport system substrate-binding protein